MIILIQPNNSNPNVEKPNARKRSKWFNDTIYDINPSLSISKRPNNLLYNLIGINQHERQGCLQNSKHLQPTPLLQPNHKLYNYNTKQPHLLVIHPKQSLKSNESYNTNNTIHHICIYTYCIGMRSFLYRSCRPHDAIV